MQTKQYVQTRHKITGVGDLQGRVFFWRGQRQKRVTFTSSCYTASGMLSNNTMAPFDPIQKKQMLQTMTVVAMHMVILSCGSKISWT